MVVVGREKAPDAVAFSAVCHYLKCTAGVNRPIDWPISGEGEHKGENKNSST